MSDSRVLSKIKKLADKDTTYMKLFIRRLGWEMTTKSVKSVFTQNGNIEECSMIKDKNISKSKGYGLVMFSDKFATQNKLDSNHVPLYLPIATKNSHIDQ